MGKNSVAEKAEQTAQPASEEKKADPVIVVSDSTAVVVRKNVISKPKKVSKDTFGNVIEER